MSAFEVIERENILNWYVLLVGLENEWCEKKCVIKYAEECLRQATGDVDCNLISIVEGSGVSNSELVSYCFNFLEAHEKAFSQDKKDKAFEIWRFAHISSLLESHYSEQEKINLLQELYSQFGFPEDMISCSIYSNDGLDPLDAAKSVMQELAKKVVVA